MEFDVWNLSLGVAFLGGVFMFFSPCVFPIFLSFLGAQAGPPGGEAGRSLKSIFSFFAGFFVIFLTMALSVTFLGQFFIRNREILVSISGFFLILFGLLTIWQKGFALIPIKLYPRNFILGLLTTIGLSPCVGPILFAILFISSSTQNYFYTILLMSFFVFGFALPFMIISRLLQNVEFFSKIPLSAIRYFSGVIFIGLGILYIFFGGAGLITYDIFHIWNYIYIIQSKILSFKFGY